jgi:hypothetical protein
MADNQAAIDKKERLNSFIAKQEKEKDSIIIEEKDSITVKSEKGELIKKERICQISKLNSDLVEKMTLLGVEKVKARRKISEKLNYLA